MNVAALVLMFFLGAQPLAAADETPAAAVVESLHATLLQIMQDADTLGYAGRVATIAPVLAQSFDFETISRIVTGRVWKDLEAAQQAEFTALFARLSAATYASNFSSFSGERFETLASEAKRNNMLVKTALVKADGEQVSLDYLLRKSNGLWRIVNVIAEGVSDLSLKRADYTAVIKSEGFSSLITQLNGKVSGYDESGR
jgi:phospholipid transport system substrate-binding protein